MEEQELNKLEQDDLKSESENDNYTEEPTFPKLPQIEAGETFNYSDGKNTISLGSTQRDVYELASLAYDFLNKPSQLETKKIPTYTQ